jgi:hypothetical protein
MFIPLLENATECRTHHSQFSGTFAAGMKSAKVYPVDHPFRTGQNISISFNNRLNRFYFDLKFTILFYCNGYQFYDVSD